MKLYPGSARAGLLTCLAMIVFSNGCGGGGGSKPARVPPETKNPVVAFAKPLPSASFASTTPIDVGARVTLESGATVSEVALYLNDGLVGIDNVKPYEWVLPEVPVGLQTLTVRATDSNGKAGEASRTLSVVDTSTLNQAVVWAVNAGGKAFTSVDGIAYSADEGFTDGATRQISAEIKATHNPALYQSERFGTQFSYAHDLPNGIYNLTLRFAESVLTSAGQRKFSVWIEGEERLNELDVLAVSGSVNTAYDVTIPQIDLVDGQLNIELKGVVDAAVLSALVVSKPHEIKSDWQLVWSDEFDYTGAPDSSKWTYEVQAPGWVNNELQRYTNSLDNARVADGVLVIEGHKNDSEYTSGRIHSQNKSDLLYGRVEVRAKLPAGRGTWPAIWMMPTDYLGYGKGWPDSGEMDIMEHVGYDPGHVHATTHNKAYYWVNGMQRKGSVRMEDVTSEFHRYSVEWNEHKINFFIDDVLYFTYVNDHRGWESWPYDKSFYVILNLAIGGNWGGAAGVDTSIWPVRMEVDYVRMYER